MTRIAFVVTHPIQYYAPLYQRLAKRGDVTIKVFFTAHAGDAEVWDEGFQRNIKWDLSLTAGYEHVHAAGAARLIARIAAWRPDVVHVTGWPFLAHLMLMLALRIRGIPVLFRGDSHLLDERQSGPRWWLKRVVLRVIYSLPSLFLVTGSANRAYYRALGIDSGRLVDCPHSIDVSRFSDPAESNELAVARSRRELGIGDDEQVVLFAGKFENKKNPLALMRAAMALPPDVVVLLVGDGELRPDIERLAHSQPSRFRILPFQNQSNMPIVYRLGDLFVLPSTHGETWGLAVNEALASGRPVLVSDRVGCAAEVVRADCGCIFPARDEGALRDTLIAMLADRAKLVTMRAAATRRAAAFDIVVTEETLVAALGNPRVAHRNEKPV